MTGKQKFILFAVLFALSAYGLFPLVVFLIIALAMLKPSRLIRW